jgi:hypothetical protein
MDTTGHTRDDKLLILFTSINVIKIERVSQGFGSGTTKYFL